MSSKNIFPFPKITKVDMQRQRSMIKKIIKLKNGNIAVASYGSVISIWNPNKKIIVQAWRSKGGVWDLIELDNEDLIAICNQENYISVYKYDEDDVGLLKSPKGLLYAASDGKSFGVWDKGKSMMEFKLEK